MWPSACCLIVPMGLYKTRQGTTSCTRHDKARQVDVLTSCLLRHAFSKHSSYLVSSSWHRSCFPQDLSWCLVKWSLVTCCLVKSCHVVSGHVLSCEMLLCLVLSCQVVSSLLLVKTCSCSCQLAIKRLDVSSMN